MKKSDITTMMVLEACISYKLKKGISPYMILSVQTKAGSMLIISAMERDVDKGYIEYGTSILKAWPTKKGMEYLTEEPI